MQGFDIQLKVISPTTIILQIFGEMNIRNAQGFRKEFDRHMKSGCREFIIDMSTMDAIDSSGIGVLFAIMKTIKPLEGLVSIFGPNQTVRTVFGLTRLNKYIPVYATLDEALAAVKKAATAASPA